MAQTKVLMYLYPPELSNTNEARLKPMTMSSLLFFGHCIVGVHCVEMDLSMMSLDCEDIENTPFGEL